MSILHMPSGYTEKMYIILFHVYRITKLLYQILLEIFCFYARCVLKVVASCLIGYNEKYTYLLTPWCRLLLEKLAGLQLVKKFPAFLWNPKVHYRTQKRPPPVPILGQPNPVHIPPSYLLEIHPNIIHPSTPRSPQVSLRFPHQDPIRPLLLTLTYINMKGKSGYGSFYAKVKDYYTEFLMSTFCRGGPR